MSWAKSHPKTGPLDVQSQWMADGSWVDRRLGEGVVEWMGGQQREERHSNRFILENDIFQYI